MTTVEMEIFKGAGADTDRFFRVRDRSGAGLCDRRTGDPVDAPSVPKDAESSQCG